MWESPPDDARSQPIFRVTPELCNKLTAEKIELKQYIKENCQSSTEILVHGVSKGHSLPQDVYNNLFDQQLPITKLILSGRGKWETCYCPKEGSTCGEQFDDILPERLTNFESIHITASFHISSCALLDLVARSPKLKVLMFYGNIRDHDHTSMFNLKRFYCDLDKIQWPRIDKMHLPTLITILKRNDNVTTFYCDAQTTLDLLPSDILPNLRFLSLNTNEDWLSVLANEKRAFRFMSKSKYLPLASNVEALELRTSDINYDVGDPPIQKVEAAYENFKLIFWREVSKMPNLKYLAIHGSWEFESVCRDIAKYCSQIEYLKINLLPSSLVTANANEDDCPILSMADGIKSLRKLPKLRSLHYVCSDKVATIDTSTTMALKEMIDLFWTIDIRTCFSNEVEDLLNNIVRRGNQQGKLYKIILHIQAYDPDNANLLAEQVLRFPSSINLKAKLNSLAETESAKRYGKHNYENFQIWGLEQVSSRDTKAFEEISSTWKMYNDRFYVFTF